MEPIATQSGDSNSNQAKVRRQFTPEQRRQILERFHQSGLTQVEFVAGEGVSKASLDKWLRAARRQSERRIKPVRFEEMPLPSPVKSWAVEIVSPQNWVLRLAQVPSPAQWQQLIGGLPC